MSQPSTTLDSAGEIAVTDTGTRLRGFWLVLAWVIWGILALLSLIDFVTSIHDYLVDVQTTCRPGSCVAGQPTLQTAEALHQFGFSVGAYAGLGVGLVIVSGLVSCGVAAVIIWRKPTGWLALLVTSMLITQALFEDNYLQGPFNNAASPWYVAGLVLSFVSPVQVLFVVALFPNGRFVPRWMGWLLLGICLIDLPANLFPALALSGPIEALFTLTGFPLVVGSMIYRYRRFSNPVERQQTKWVVFGVTVVIFTFMLWFIPQLILFAGLSQPGSLYDLIGHPLFLISTLAIPICIGIAILRYRLWDIDVLINRALVYGSLTGLLAAAYAGLIIGLESLAELVTKRASQPVVLVVSTLVIAALVQPVRTRLQSIIDHRFYRRKYDAEKTLAAFSATLRHQVDLDQLREQVLAVVQETMQPAQVSLWLGQLERHPTDRAYRLEPQDQVPTQPNVD
jgi:hypothetical protein